jgi:hypothetical protein
MKQNSNEQKGRPTVTPLTADDMVIHIDWLTVVGASKTKLCGALQRFNRTFDSPNGKEGMGDNKLEELIG